MGTALVTGASSGIGECFARQLAFLGDNLILVARREDRLQQLAEKLRSEQGINVEVIGADLTQDTDINRLARTIQERTDISMLVNNAGFTVTGFFADIPLEGALGMVKLHVETTVRLCHAALPNMRKKGNGTIINVASFGGFIPAPNNGIYNATKAFLLSFSDSLAYEEAPNGITVQVLCPGFTHTEIFEAADVSEYHMALIPKIAWLNSDEVVSTSLAALAKKRHIVTPGIVYQLARRIFSVPLFAHWLKLYIRSLSD